MIPHAAIVALWWIGILVVVALATFAAYILISLYFFPDVFREPPGSEDDENG